MTETITERPPARRPRVELEPLTPGLHSRYYTDPGVLALEQERIFSKTWQVVAHESDVPNAGSRVVGQVGSTEIIVVRTESGEIRAHVNTCRHRGTRLVAEPGEEKALRCPYHGWTYHLDGELVGAPEGRSIPCLDKAKLGLFPVRTEVVCGLVFANLDPAAEPLAAQLQGILPLLRRYLSGPLEQFSDYRLHRDEPEDQQAANWKVVVDNYLEGYHVPVAHPGLMRLLDYKQYSVQTEGSNTLYEAPLRDKPSDNWQERMYQRLVRPMPGLLPEDERVFRYVAIYPNTVIDLYPDHVLVWKMNPHAVDRTGVPGAYLRRTDIDARTRAAQWLNLRISQITTHEDEDLVARMQRGLGNGDFTPGPLSLREAGVAWFADRVRHDLGELAPEHPTSQNGESDRARS
jgi:Rieske 2Fe-2S family protein